MLHSLINTYLDFSLEAVDECKLVT